jgi:CheY-specific phosphatase CheX
LSPDFLLCAVIGFSGKNVRGTLVLALTEELPMLSSPIGPMPANPATRAITQRDWVGELANQLLGRVKIELLRCGVEIYLNLPAVLRGKHLAPLPRVELKPLKFTLGESVVALWVETEALPGFKIDGQHLDDQQGPAAGDALLFE